MTGNFFGGAFFGGGFFGAIGPTPPPPNPIRDGGGGAQGGYAQQHRKRIEQDEADVQDIVRLTMPHIHSIIARRH